MSLTDFAWFLIGAYAMGCFAVALLFLHRPTRRRWRDYLNEDCRL